MPHGATALCLLSALVACGPKSTTAPSPRTNDELVEPLAYELSLEISPDEEVFRGSVVIDIRLAAPSSVLRLHGHELELTNARVAQGQLLRPELLGEGVLALHAKAPIPAGRHRLELKWTAKQGNQVGIFRQKFGDEWFSFSDFQPVDARRAFPCFDEPRWKTPWTITVTAPKELKAYSNQVLRESALVGDKRVHRFAVTRPLPSYLVAVAVGDFEEVTTVGGTVPGRILVPQGSAPRVAYAAKRIPEYLRWLESYTDVKTPATKLDWVVVPRMAGAMENQGLITVGSDIMFHEGSDGENHAAFLSMVLAHELVHTWFGNLVTMKDWNELWVSEGITTWLADEVLIATGLSDWVKTRQMKDRNEAFALDVHGRSRALGRAPKSYAQMNQLFSNITYRKGPAIMELIARYVGREAVREGLRTLLRRHRTVPATRRDVALAFGATTGAIIESFTERVGFPQVSYRKSCEGGQSIVELEEQSSKPWSFPVCRQSDGNSECQLAEHRKTRLAFAAPCEDTRLDLVSNPYVEVVLTREQVQNEFPKDDLKTHERIALGHAIGASVRKQGLDPGVAFEELVQRLDASDLAASAAYAKELAELLRHLPPAKLESFRRWSRGQAGVVQLGAKVTLATERSPAAAALMHFFATWLDDPKSQARAKSLSDAALRGAPGPDLLYRPALQARAWNATPRFIGEMVQVLRKRPNEGPYAIFALASIAVPATLSKALALIQRATPELVPTVLTEVAANPRVAEVALEPLRREPATRLSSKQAARLADAFAKGLCRESAKTELKQHLGDAFKPAHAIQLRQCEALATRIQNAPLPWN